MSAIVTTPEMRRSRIMSGNEIANHLTPLHAIHHTPAELTDRSQPIMVDPHMLLSDPFEEPPDPQVTNVI
jgi:hypothetical protein